ncbi:MAG: hypothetical protein RR177_03540 [Oscillospiraceae bacterium]
MKNGWKRLDNAAKIFPTASYKSDSQVFRFSCELYKKIDMEILQTALDETIQVFDIYRYVMRRGLFWYYLESSDIEPIVEEEHKKIFADIYDCNHKNLLFSVSFFECRVNLETYHVLSDGTGAMNFLKLLMNKYLSMKKNLPEPSLDYDASQTQMQDDSFLKYYRGSKNKDYVKPQVSLQIKGPKYLDDKIKVITGCISTPAILAKSREHGVTATAYLAACMMCAIAENSSVSAKKKPIILCVPVNLRKHFPSQSARNFFGTVTINYDFSKEPADFESIVQEINIQLRKKLTTESLSQNMDGYSALEHNIVAKIVPLFLKNIILKYAYRISMKMSTGTISNIGVVTMPREFDDDIRQFEVSSSTTRIQTCICSYNDAMTISFTSPFISTDIQRSFFRHLQKDGFNVEITANLVDEDDKL